MTAFSFREAIGEIVRGEPGPQLKLIRDALALPDGARIVGSGESGEFYPNGVSVSRHWRRVRYADGREATQYASAASGPWYDEATP